MSSKGKQKKRKIKCEDQKCLFCSDTKRDVLKFGRMYKFDDIYVHYYCLLLSSGLEQKGKDNEGIFGFLTKDITREYNRGEKLKCHYCKNIGATIGCSVKTCKVTFHLPCGLKNNASNQFYKSFQSFCVKHRPRQTLDSSHEINDLCSICMSNLEFDEGLQVLSASCCHKLFHRKCLQQQALSAGYFFKCPLCNNGKQFIETMNEFGVYVPKQDASWETEDNAYGDLYQRHSRCDQIECLCPEGRQHRGQSDWQLLLCDTCGSNGTHWKCIQRTDYNDVWICNECQSVGQQTKRCLDPKDIQSNEGSDNDIEIIPIIECISVRPNENNLKISTIKSSNDSNQLSETNVDYETKKVKRLKKTQMKDVAIQCNLVAAENLIDSDPITELSPYSFRTATITLNSIKKNEDIAEVIDIDSDDEIILLN